MVHVSRIQLVMAIAAACNKALRQSHPMSTHWWDWLWIWCPVMYSGWHSNRLSLRRGKQGGCPIQPCTNILPYANMYGLCMLFCCHNSLLEARARRPVSRRPSAVLVFGVSPWQHNSTSGKLKRGFYVLGLTTESSALTTSLACCMQCLLS